VVLGRNTARGTPKVTRRTCPRCAARRYYSEQYVAKGGLDKELDFAEDDVVLGRVPA